MSNTKHKFNDEQKLINGVCPLCGESMKIWTREDIDLAKDDMGMDADDDFCDCCNECAKQFYKNPDDIGFPRDLMESMGFVFIDSKILDDEIKRESERNDV